MKVIKPQQLSVLTRSYEFRRKFHLGISAIAFAPMAGERALITEQAMWPVVAQQLDGSPVLDVGIPKRKAEYLVCGSAFAPRGEPATQCTVMVEIAGRRKLLQVTGDRVWRTTHELSLPSPAAPFTSLPLTWKRAFGGSNYPSNPDGCGYLPESGLTADSGRLPNIEYPTQRVVRATDRPEPAGFGPIDVSWEPRAKKAGTHDLVWLEQDFPGFARDLAWEYFNLAPGDQWFDAPFAHDLSYEFYHLHPSRPHLEGRLPSLRARGFVQREGRDHERFTDWEELTLALTTLWFFPSIERVALIFQGSVETAEDDASDVTHLLAGFEDASTAALSADHYRDVAARRCDRKTSHLYTLKDSELCAQVLIAPATPSYEADAGHEDLARQRALRRMRSEIDAARARVVALGLDPDVHGPGLPEDESPPPTLEELPEFLAKTEKDLELQQVKLHEEQAKRDADNERLFERLGLDYGTVRAERERKVVGPPAFTAAAKVAELETMIRSFEARGLPTDHIQAIIDDPEMRRTWHEAETLGREAYRASAHMQGSVPAQDAVHNHGLRDHVREALSRGESLAGFDLTAADLSEMKLDGANLEGAFLDTANLTNASLTGANLCGAVLAHAQAEGCDFSAANLSGCNLGMSRCARARFDRAQLVGTIFAHAELSSAVFEAAKLEGTDLTGASLNGARFTHAVAKQLTLDDVSLSGVDFSHATLAQCNLLRLDLTGASFREADLTGTLFLGCRGQCDFVRARLHNVRMVEGCSFDGSDFSHADLRDSNLRTASFHGARFHGATLDRADFTRARLGEADLTLVRSQQVNLSRADLRKARLRGANLMFANLSSARLEGADFGDTNLFGADLSRIRVDEASRYDGVLATRARLHPRYTPHRVGQ